MSTTAKAMAAEVKVKRGGSIRIVGEDFEVVVTGSGFVNQFLLDEDGEEVAFDGSSWIPEERRVYAKIRKSEEEGE
jgi:hypothetical protein